MPDGEHSIMTQYTRRTLIQHGVVSTIAALVPNRLWAGAAAPPLSSFDKDSTAEQVTAGLDLSGRTYAITGANSGLGYETMRVLSLRGAHVIGIARSAEKARAACDSVGGNTTPAHLDLAVPASIVSCAGQIRAMDMPIDGLVCNAGIMALPELEQINGIEKQFAVNHLGHFILINQLYDSVLAADQGRFVIVSSDAHTSAPEVGIQFDDLGFDKGEYKPWTAYGHSKLANALCARELAKRLDGTSATANSLHPGVINTNLGRHMPWYMRVAAGLLGWAFMKTVEEGAATQTYLATNPALGEVSGLYFADCNPAEGSPHLSDDAMAAKLWTVSEELTADYLRG
jgi:NAD(P)-dependent dehydrogenase (short-subunit alcohol dehydrogenase family)